MIEEGLGEKLLDRKNIFHREVGAHQSDAAIDIETHPTCVKRTKQYQKEVCTTFKCSQLLSLILHKYQVNSGFAFGRNFVRGSILRDIYTDRAKNKKG